MTDLPPRAARRVLVTALLAAGTALATTAGAQQGQLLDPDVRDALAGELSGTRAKAHVVEICQHHRIQGSRGYRRAAEYVLERLRSFGFDEEHAWVESFPSDGRVTYQTWQSPSGWDIQSAELRMVAPTDERLVAFPEIPMSVVTYSNAGEAEAPLVFVGAGTTAADYDDVDVEGRFVLATGYGGTVHRRAVVERGAAAVVCYLDDERVERFPDMIGYTGMWPRTEELDQVTFGFNLSHRQGERLRALLEGGEEVVLSGRVEGIGLEPYEMDVVVATIEGRERPDEELVVVAHLDHPQWSANDNASGSAAALELAHALRALVDAGRLRAPRRTLRFLWVPEFYGTMAYVDAHPELAAPERGGGVLGCVNMDMVGEDTDLLDCRLEITANPASLPSAFDDVVADMAAMVDGMRVEVPGSRPNAFNYRLTPYAPGSDHMVFIDRGVPATMLWHDPDPTHHTSEDTPDKVDPVELERCALIAGGTVWYLAELGQRQAIDLAWTSAAASTLRLGRAGQRAHRMIADAGTDEVARAWAEAANVLDQASRHEFARLSSIRTLSLEAGVLERILSTVSMPLLNQWEELRAALRLEANLRGAPGENPPPLHEVPDERVPARRTRGPLAFDLLERRLPPERWAWYARSGAPGRDVRFELVNLVDGERTVTAIRDALSAAHGPVPLGDVGRVLDDLVSLEVMAWL